MNIDATDPDFWFIVTLQFAILANVNDSYAPVVLLAVTSLITAGLLIYETAPGAYRAVKRKEGARDDS